MISSGSEPLQTAGLQCLTFSLFSFLLLCSETVSVELEPRTGVVSAPDDKRDKHGAAAEWRWQGKDRGFEAKPAPLPLCPLQIPCRLSWERTRASAIRNQLTFSQCFVCNIGLQITNLSGLLACRKQQRNRVNHHVHTQYQRKWCQVSFNCAHGIIHSTSWRSFNSSTSNWHVLRLAMLVLVSTLTK